MGTSEQEQHIWRTQPPSSTSEAESLSNPTYSDSFHHEADVTDPWKICWLVNGVNCFNMAGNLSKTKVATVQRSMHYTTAYLNNSCNAYTPTICGVVLQELLTGLLN